MYTEMWAEQKPDQKPDQTVIDEMTQKVIRLESERDKLQGSLNLVLQTIVNSLDSDKTVLEHLSSYHWHDVKTALNDQNIHIPTETKTVTFEIETKVTVEIELELPVTFDDSSDVNDYVNSWTLQSQLTDALRDSEDLEADDYEMVSVK